jgi:chromosome segregation ATPase
MKQLGNTVEGLQSLESKVQSLQPRLETLEESTKQLDSLNEVTKSTDSILASQSRSLETFNQKVEVLLADFDEQHEKLHTLEEQVKNYSDGFHQFLFPNKSCLHMDPWKLAVRLRYND